MQVFSVTKEGALLLQYVLLVRTKHLNLVEQINRKNLKIPVFGGLRVNLVVFEFVPMIPQENLVKFDL